MSHSTPDPDDVNASDAKVPTPAHGEPPLFTLLAGLATVTCLFTPRITLMLPVMAAVGCGVAAYVKHERGQKAGLIAAALAIVLLFVSSYQLSAPSWSNLGAAKIVATHWFPDPEFAGHGAIKWNVEVRNLSDRPIARVKVEFIRMMRRAICWVATSRLSMQSRQAAPGRVMVTRTTMVLRPPPAAGLRKFTSRNSRAGQARGYLTGRCVDRH